MIVKSYLGFAALIALPFGALNAEQPSAPSVDVDRALPTEPIFLFTDPEGNEQLVTGRSLTTDRLDKNTANLAFHAVVSAEWIPGLVPIYIRRSDNTFSLHRRPKRGQENSTEPFFFGLPLSSETNAMMIAGRWECEATHVDGARDYYAWDLTLAGDDLVGRFDQNTDYRFAYVTGGTFRSERLILNIDYVTNQYRVTGDYRDGSLVGRWEQITGADHGEWFGKRPTSNWKFPDESGALLLFEWKKKDGSSIRRYVTKPPSPESEWERVGEAICRVWAP